MVDMIDYTLLQKRGIIKKRVEKKLPFKINSDGMIELTDYDKQTENISGSANNALSSLSANSGGLFGFLDSAAQSSPATSTSPSYDNKSSENSDMAGLRIKIDDLEYKIERLIERLELLERRG